MRAVHHMVTAVLMISASALQAGNGYETPSGRFEFLPTVTGPKGPLCREVWTFDAEAGTLRVESGSEVALKRFRLESDMTETWLVTNLIETNGGANCSGLKRDPNDRSDHVVYLIELANGAIEICPEPLRSDDGTAPRYGGCYGTIRKLDERP